MSVAADDVERPKPDPQLHLAACDRLGADPAWSVAFEDSGTGVGVRSCCGAFVVVVVPSVRGTRLDHD